MSISENLARAGNVLEKCLVAYAVGVVTATHTTVNGTMKAIETVGQAAFFAGRKYGQVLLGQDYNNIKRAAVVTAVQCLSLATLMAAKEVPVVESIALSWTAVVGINSKFVFYFHPGLGDMP